MSLVITVWNESMGVAVSEGRVAAKIDGQYVPIEEDYSKLTRLPNGSILGITGNVVEGFPVAVPLRDVVAGWLRPTIAHAAESLGFRELSAYVPKLLRHCANLFPGLNFQVCLLGTDEGVVRGGAWSTDGQAELPCTTGVAWQILGIAETSAEAHTAVRESLQCAGGMRSLSFTAEMLQGIIRALAPRHQEINDRTRVEFITGKNLAACASMTADMITSGTLDAARVNVTNLDADNIATGTLSASKVLFPDGSALTTAARVTTATSTLSASQTFTGSIDDISGLSFSVTAAPDDVFNIWVQADLLGAADGLVLQLQLVVDGTVEAWRYLGVGAQEISALSIFTVTGLSAGTHSFTFKATCMEDSSIQMNSNTVAICQRVF